MRGYDYIGSYIIGLVSEFTFVKIETLCIFFEHCNCFLDPIKAGDFLPALVAGDFTNVL